MSTTSAVSPYGSVGPFASQNVQLDSDTFSRVLFFLKPEDMANIERVCSSWKKFIKETDQWKKQCQYLLNIPANIDPMDYLPKCSSYKDAIKLVLSRILGEDIYRNYLGAEVGPVPPIPEEISLKRFNEPDPCEQSETIGQNYVWLYCPERLEITVDGKTPFYLDKEDDPNDVEAPMLKKAGLVGSLMKKIHPESISENKILKVPNTINNIEVLFKHPKKGNSSNYNNIWIKISKQHGNKRTQSGWVCMRKNVIGLDRSFIDQQKVVKKAGVVIPSLLQRITYNFMEHLRTNVYPDGGNPKIFARTSTTTLYSNSNYTRTVPSHCGGRSPLGLSIDGFIGLDSVQGVAVALPTEVQTNN